MLNEKNTSHLFPQTSNGRHLMRSRCAGFTIYNGHLESGSQRRARAERKAQLEYVVGMPEQDDGRACVLAVDGNMREGEDACLLQAGWRDVWILAKNRPRDVWTWMHKNQQHSARYDRVYIYSGENVSVECLSYDVIKTTWGTLTDHCALQVVMQFTDSVEVLEPAHVHARIASEPDVCCDVASTYRSEEPESLRSASGETLRAEVPIVRVANATTALVASWRRSLSCLDSFGA